MYRSRLELACLKWCVSVLFEECVSVLLEKYASVLFEVSRQLPLTVKTVVLNPGISPAVASHLVPASD